MSWIIWIQCQINVQDISIIYLHHTLIQWFDTIVNCSSKAPHLVSWMKKFYNNITLSLYGYNFIPITYIMKNRKIRIYFFLSTYFSPSFSFSFLISKTVHSPWYYIDILSILSSCQEIPFAQIRRGLFTKSHLNRPNQYYMHILMKFILSRIDVNQTS